MWLELDSWASGGVGVVEGGGGVELIPPRVPPHGFFSNVFRGYLFRTSELTLECMVENDLLVELHNLRPVNFRNRPYFESIFRKIEKRNL